MVCDGSGLDPHGKPSAREKIIRSRAKFVVCVCGIFNVKIILSFKSIRFDIELFNNPPLIVHCAIVFAGVACENFSSFRLEELALGHNNWLRRNNQFIFIDSIVP